MNKKIAICPGCNTKIPTNGKPGEKINIQCPNCKRKGTIIFKTDLQELDFYPLNEPFAHAKILKNKETLEKTYKVIEPYLTEKEQQVLTFIWETLLKTLNIRLDELDNSKIENYLIKQTEQVINSHDLKVDNLSKQKILYYIKRESLGFGKIDPIMRDPHIEDISCDGSEEPIFLYHRKYGSLKSNIQFTDEEELSFFVVRLAQKCGKHISIAEPILDATMPDGSRIQMTLSTEVTTKGSTFTIRKFRADPFTPPDLIALHTASAEILAYFWLAVENGINALIAGGTASGKTTILNALSLFIPREAKIVSIEETREINLPHPNWIPGVARSGFGEIVGGKVIGEIDLYDLMKAALRQRPEYILVGEIRGREAYVLFQAMATGHTTYSTVHADSAKSLIHRLEGKPIEIPRIMLQSLDVVSIHITTRVKGRRVRRCKQVIEIIDIDPTTKEILTNEVFRWDPVEDKFIYTGKSYVLEGIRARWDLSKEQISNEVRTRTEILKWMDDNDVRIFREVAKVISGYAEDKEEFLKKMRKSGIDQKRNIVEEDKKDDKQKKGKKEISKPVKEPETKIIIQKSSDREHKHAIFKGIKSIDEITAEFLFDNGIKSVDDLNELSIKDLIKITGIKRKEAKKIMKELGEYVKI
jgi:flagellar protein FlaI